MSFCIALLCGKEQFSVSFVIIWFCLWKLFSRKIKIGFANFETVCVLSFFYYIFLAHREIIVPSNMPLPFMRNKVSAKISNKQ